MTAHLTRIDTPPSYAPAGLPASYAMGPMVPPPVGHFSWRRYLSALYRYKWLIVALTLLGAAAGVVIARRSTPQYEVHATVWLSAETPQARTAGPIRPERLLNTSSWPDLIGSFAILDSVARKTHSYIVPEDKSSASALAAFSTADRYKPGTYEVRVTAGTNRYELLEQNVVRERGALGDSIGVALGFRWAPSDSLLQRSSPIRFEMKSTREAAVELRSGLLVSLPRESSLLRLVLTGSDPQQTTETMDTLLSEFMATASRLKRRNLADFASTLDQQVTYAAGELRSAESELETFRVRTITLPSEGGGTVAAGLEMTRDPVLKHFFDQKLQLDSIRNDRESLQRILSGVQAKQLETYALWSIPAVHGSPELTTALTELATKEAALRSALQLYTDEHRTVTDLRQRITTLRTQTIPQLASSLLDDVSRKEQELTSRVEGSSRELQQIPRRTIEEMRLRRNVEVRQTLYTMLKSRYEEARLSEASALPDLSVLDYPAVPQTPTRNTASRTILIAVTLSFGVAILLAILLDHLDGRFRHPEQATHDLGLDIIGVVPTVRASSSGKRHGEEAWQVTECFRTMRLALLHRQANEATGRMLAVSSPSSGEGKSLVASNLAVSLAKAGHRTLLIDGDVRRGCLHSTFAVRSRPGLTDFLAGSAALHEILREVDGGLTVIPSGSRDHRSPELLSSPAMREMLAQVRQQYDSIIVDCAPFNAGVDAYAVGALTTNMVLVLRAGVTDCRLAEAKLKLVDQLPINVLGAVLNAVQTTGEYRYYAYHYKQTPSIPSPNRVRTLFVD